MANPYKFTLGELLLIIAGALAVNAYLVHRDHEQVEQIIAETRAAEAVQGPVNWCEQDNDCGDAPCSTDSECMERCPENDTECDGGPQS